MRSKTVLTALLCGASVLLIQTGQAQPTDASPTPVVSGTEGHRGGHAGKGKARLEHLTQALDLTADQQSQIKAIFKASRPEIKALRENASLSKQDKHAQIKAIREANRAKMRAILTPDQQIKLDAMKTNFEKKHGKAS